jgi:hypothetical protein
MANGLTASSLVQLIRSTEHAGRLLNYRAVSG